MDVLKIETREELEDWFDERPLAVVQVVAARAALRSLPYIVEAKNVKNFAGGILLPVFWAVAISWVARVYPTHDIEAAFARSAARTAARFAADSSASEHSISSAFSARSAAALAATSDTSGSAHFAGHPGPAAWQESLQDCAFFDDAVEQGEEAEHAARDLAGRPLWRIQSMPAETLERWNELKDFLSNAVANWQVWRDWYQARLDGGKTLDVPSDLLETVDVGIATLDKELWKQGPAVVNAKILELMDGGNPVAKFDDASKQQILEEMKLEVDRFFQDHSMKFAAQVQKTSGAQEEVFTTTLSDILKEQYALVTTKAKKAVETESSKIQEIASSAIAGLREEHILKESYELWGEKKVKHICNFRIAAGAFIALIIFCGLVGWWNFSDIKSLITAVTLTGKTGDTVIGTAQLLSQFLIFTLPVAIIVWVLRAILRFANLNLSLAEDAAQREVMAKTYVNFFVANQLTEKEDRQLMLAALFRPLPGIQEIDAAPTSLMDFINPKSK